MRLQWGRWDACNLGGRPGSIIAERRLARMQLERMPGSMCLPTGGWEAYNYRRGGREAYNLRGAAGGAHNLRGAAWKHQIAERRLASMQL